MAVLQQVGRLAHPAAWGVGLPGSETIGRELAQVSEPM